MGFALCLSERKSVLKHTLATSAEGSSYGASLEPSFLLKAGSRFRHFPELDGLRGCAVLMVVVGHTLTFRYWRAYQWNLGTLGVLLFFVLSGFLITGLLCAEERRRGTISLKGFYRRRVFRILPAVFVYILAVSVLKRVGLVTDTSWKGIVHSLFFVQNIFGGGLSVGQLWSLSLEEQFYLVWPLLLLLFGRRHLFAPTLGLILATWVYRAVAIAIAPYDYGQGIFEHRSDFRMDSILVGCAIALFFDRRREAPPPNGTLVRWLTHPSWVIPMLFAWSVLYERPPFLGVYLTVQTAFVCCLVLHIILFPDSVVGRVLRLRWLRFAGLISYSLYLWNQLFIAVSVPDWGFIRRIPFCLFATAAVACLSYFFVERPFLRLKRRFESAGEAA